MSVHMTYDEWLAIAKVVEYNTSHNLPATNLNYLKMVGAGNSRDVSDAACGGLRCVVLRYADVRTCATARRDVVVADAFSGSAKTCSSSTLQHSSSRIRMSRGCVAVRSASC